jgi:threonine synthase
VNGYRCIACNKTQAANFAGFLCPHCGNNFDITYDYETASKKIGSGFAIGNDIFRYAPLLPVKTPGSPFPLRIGATPLYRSYRLGQAIGLSNLWLKDETGHPSASIKDRASAIALQRAVDVGAKTVAVASTGNAGSSTACVAAALGLRAMVLVPASAPTAKLTQSLAYGATLLAVRGSYDDAFDLCLEAAREFGWFNRSTGVNPFTREGKKTCAYEIWEGLGRVPDRVIVPTGDGNIISGMWKGWRDLQAVGLIDRLPKIDCAQAHASAAISDSIRRVRQANTSEPEWTSIQLDQVSATTIADSISVDRPRDGLAAVKAVIQSGGEAVTLTDDEILAAIPEMAQATGIFAEPAAAASWAAVKQLLREDKIGKDEHIVCVVSGSGLKDIPAAQQSAGELLMIDPSIDAIRDALA